MAIKNFIEFATDKIHPDVFSEYRESNYSEGDFTGSDSSTLDFTKLGWVMSIREKMKRENTLTSDVDTLINEMFSMESSDESGTKSNYKTLSNGNYNLLQQLVFDNRANDDFSFDFSYISSFGEAMTALLYDKFDDNQMSAAEMVIEFGLHNAVGALDIDKLGSESTDSIASKRFSVYMYAYQKAAAESVSIPDGTGKAAKTLNVVRSKVDAGLVSKYNGFYFQNATSQSSAAYPKNEISRMVSFLSHNLLEGYIGKIIEDLGAPDESSIFASAISSAVSGTSGFSSTQVRFDADAYKARVEGSVHNMGYSPLYFYISRYKTECRKSILDEMSKAFSPLAISIGSSLNDGFTPLSLLASYMEIGDDDSWVNSDMASFIMDVISSVSSAQNSFEVFASLGSVRDFTGGKTNNAFGTVNNIFSTINARHKSWWAEESAKEDNSSTIDDFKSTFDSLSGSIFSGGAFSYSNYKIWMFEYGKEIS